MDEERDDSSNLRRDAARAQALRRVATAVAEGADPAGLFVLIAHEAALALEVEAGGVVRFEGDETVNLGAWNTTGDPPPPGLRQQLLNGTPMATARFEGRAEWVSGSGGAAAPIRIGGENWGAIIVTSTRPNAVDAGTAAMLEELAQLLVLAIANAAARRALTEETRRRNELADVQAALHRVARRVATEPGLPAVAMHVAEEAARLLDAAAAAVQRYDSEGNAEIIGAWPPEVAALLPPDAVVPFDEILAISQCWVRGEPVRVDGYAHPLPEFVARAKFQSAAAAPIFTDQGLWGAVSVASHEIGSLPVLVEERLGAFAELVAVAIANADAHAELLDRARSDALTGVANHRTFYESLTAEVRRAGRYGRDLALVLVDLDGFKELNDTHGHPEGDQVLVQFADRLTEMVRGGELVARLGGDEFAIVLPESDDVAALGLAERVRRCVLEEPLAGHPMTISAGVCDAAQAGGDPEQLVRLADRALYWAKSNGRNQSWRYSTDVVSELSDAELSAKLARSRALAALGSLARVVDLRDPSTQRHSERVAVLVCWLAEMHGWPSEEIDRLREAALIHDVGKVAISDAVLYKPGPLDRDEYEEVKRHAAIGAEIASEALADEQVAWIRHHHERADGTGYPDGLSGDQIPLGAQLMAIADAFDVMTNARHYTSPIRSEAALEECRAHRDRQFTPYAVEALERLWAERRLDLAGEADRAPAGTADDDPS